MTTTAVTTTALTPRNASGLGVHPSASFSATLRVHLKNHPGSFAALANAIASSGGLLGAIDLVCVGEDEKVRDVIGLFREYGVSQVPVVRAEPPLRTSSEVAGSVAEAVSEARPWARGSIDGLPELSALLASATVTPVATAFGFPLVLTVAVIDGDRAVVAEIASRGLEPAERETYSNGVRKATFRDPDGNEIGFGGAPAA